MNPLSANPKNDQTHSKQFVDRLPTNCVSVVDDFVGLALRGLISSGLLTWLTGVHSFS